MIEDEIRVGDVFTRTSTVVRVEEVHNANGTSVVNYSFATSEPDQRGWSSMFEDRLRHEFGRVVDWTPITPETLPGDEVYAILVTDQCAITSADRVGSWAQFPGIAKLRGYTHWRPIPAEWLPLPVNP